MSTERKFRGDDKSQPLDIALQYLQRSWQPVPVPVPYRQKRSVLDGWQKLDITEANIGEYFDQRRQNVGVQLGSRSDGLTDAL